MSEFINTNDNRATIRWKLLTGASALALTVYASSSSIARAEDADRPIIWVELGGQMDLMQGLSSNFTAPFMTAITPTPGPYSADIFTKGQRPPRIAFGGNAAITFQPENSSWLVSASVRYGRSHGDRHIHHQSPTPVPTVGGNPVPASQGRFGVYAAAFADSEMPYGERHAILDFSVGRDFGIGFLGHDGSSEISAGVRSAEASSNENLTIHARPEIIIKRAFGIFPKNSFHNYTMWASANRNFRGTGPSLNWAASTSIAGNMEDGELVLDWDVNAAILFGRQKAKTDHKTHSYAFGTRPPKYNTYVNGYYHHTPPGSTRSKSVTVPSIGGHVGLSVKYPNAKVSIGYRYDTFLNAMDTGIDAAKKSNLTFNGPYASISIGIGD